MNVRLLEIVKNAMAKAEANCNEWVDDPETEKAKAAILAYEGAVGDAVNIDAIALSRAMAIAGVNGTTHDATYMAEILRNLAAYHPKSS